MYKLQQRENVTIELKELIASKKLKWGEYVSTCVDRVRNMWEVLIKKTSGSSEFTANYLSAKGNQSNKNSNRRERLEFWSLG